jgi:hypothetical protein
MEQPDETSDDRLATLANRLYWTSEWSVGRIAEDLDIARGTLYGLVQPLPSSVPCPECGAEMVFANRTARDRRLLACPGCGLVEDEDLIQAALDAAAANDDPAARPRVVSHRSTGNYNGRTWAGVAALGAAVGLMCVYWVRRR